MPFNFCVESRSAASATGSLSTEQIRAPGSAPSPKHPRTQHQCDQRNDRGFGLQREQIGIVYDQMHVGRHYHHADPDQTGEARPAVKAGKRYIRIPALDEATQQIHGQEDRAARVAYEKGDLDLDDEQCEEFIGSLEVDAQFRAAFNWLGSLQLPMRAAIYEFGDEDRDSMEDPDWIWDGQRWVEP